MSGYAKSGSSAAGSLVAAPKTLRYERDGGLPVAIEAKSNRRTFTPANGSNFRAGQTIRITLNSQSFIDFSHSYLQFKFTNDSADGRTVGLDMGCPFFSRLQIMSGGQELEDIGEYSRLYSILESIQGSRLTADEHSLAEHQNFTGVAVTTDAMFTDGSLDATGVNTQVGVASGNYLHNAVTQVANGDSKVFNVPLVSAIFNIEKYFPL